MAELADALDSGSSEGNLMQVQVLLSAPIKRSLIFVNDLFSLFFEYLTADSGIE
jgi:hypothetical protein